MAPLSEALGPSAFHRSIHCRGRSLRCAHPHPLGRYARSLVTPRGSVAISLIWRVASKSVAPSQDATFRPHVRRCRRDSTPRRCLLIAAFFFSPLLSPPHLRPRLRPRVSLRAASSLLLRILASTSLASPLLLAWPKPASSRRLVRSTPTARSHRYVSFTNNRTPLTPRRKSKSMRCVSATPAARS